jgi:hypothetical protein
MRTARRLFVGFYVALGIWLAALVIADARNLTCNPDDLTDCDGLGNLLLAVSLLMPVPLVVLLGVLCIATIGLLRDMSAAAWVRQPLVVAVMGTLSLLAIVLGIALFGNLEALV